MAELAKKETCSWDTLFDTPWGEKYKDFMGKVFQIIPFVDPDFLEFPTAVMASEIISTTDGYVIQQNAHKIPFGAFVIYVTPFLLKMDRETEEEPILFGHVAYYNNVVVIIPPNNIDEPYRGGW